MIITGCNVYEDLILKWYYVMRPFAGRFAWMHLRHPENIAKFATDVTSKVFYEFAPITDLLLVAISEIFGGL